MHLETRFLSTFRAVAECGSFTGAASLLGITQSAVSQQISALENHLGAALLIRSNRLIGLTPAGEVFLQCARQVLKKLEEANSLVAEYARNGRGRLRVGAQTGACSMLLPQIVREFHICFPKADLMVVTAGHGHALDRVAQRDFDFALLCHPPVGRQLELTEVGRDELLAVMPPRHPLSRRSHLLAPDLRDQPMVLAPHGSAEYQSWRHFMMEAGIFPLVAVETDDLELAKTLVAQGVGITIAPRWAVRRELDEGSLSGVSLGKGLWRSWYLASCGPDHHGAVHRGFANLCAAHLPDLLACIETKRPDPKSAAPSSEALRERPTPA